MFQLDWSLFIFIFCVFLFVCVCMLNLLLGLLFSWLSSCIIQEREGGKKNHSQTQNSQQTDETEMNAWINFMLDGIYFILHLVG